MDFRVLIRVVGIVKQQQGFLYHWYCDSQEWFLVVSSSSSRTSDAVFLLRVEDGGRRIIRLGLLGGG
jgi:hypothetical protein